MRLFNLHQGSRIFYFVLVLLFLSLTNAGNSSANSPDVPAQKKVKLKKDARANGYKITFRQGAYFIEAVKVTDPDTKKLIEGLHRLLYRCSENGPELPVPVTFTRGNSPKTGIGCALPFEPQVLLLDEPAPGQ